MMIFRRMLVIVILAAVFSAVDGATLRQPGARMPEASPADVRAGDDARTPAAAPMSGIPSVSSPSSDAYKNVPVTYSRLNTRGRSLSTMSMQTEWTPVFLPPTYPCDDMYDTNEWLFIANHDVHGYDIGGRENSLQEAMTKCSEDNTCKAVNSDGYKKHTTNRGIINPWADGSGECEGLFVKRECPVFDETKWQYTNHKDVHGYDLGARKFSLEEAMNFCLGRADCKGINSNFWTKWTADPAIMTPYELELPCEGFYTKLD